ncbi:hypothetical protein TCE0_042r14530 [Talaromyces pinophilus]|uniref:Uncharacterized protein n=1 Tax=Talaromyces pinophilus TaxID=128442 RepID=A0A6V8HI97_TALPI|nr:hypothetical protein TCE0_042r14530 [Talaromyces pinophilus]
MAFWKNWETWEKMVFILAFSMVGVIIAGGCVAWLNRRKVKLYNQAFADESGRIRNIVSPDGTRISDVPFGARALESGIQVDGIYTPGRYTPRQGTLRQNAAGSPVLGVPTPLTPTVTRASQYEPYSPQK